jgi:transketolase
MRAAVRLSALSHIPSIWIYTHDSIGVGEDGPTHQPVEQIASLRAMPDLLVIRPADANEVAEAWRVILTHRHQPVALILSRQSTPTLNRDIFAPANGLERGAYVLKDFGKGRLRLILMASGAEVDLVVKAGIELAREGVRVRVVSFPSWELFNAQDKTYRDSVLPPRVKARLSVEAGVSQGWEKWVGDRGSIIAVDRFGASAPGPVLFEKFGFTVENVIARARELL